MGISQGMMAASGYLISFKETYGRGRITARKRLLTKFTAALFISGTFCGASAADLPALRDPVFHMTLQPDVYSKGFAELPQEMLQRCHLAISDKASYRDWILASVSTPEGNYMLLAGVVREKSKWQGDPQGAFIRIGAGDCVAIDPADGVFDAADAYGKDPALTIPRQVFADLAGDAVGRYAKALGSKDALIASLRQQGQYESVASQPLLHDALGSR